MPKTRVFALAKELNLESKALIALLNEMGVKGLTPASVLEDELVAKAREGVRQHARIAASRTDAERAVAAPARLAPGALALAQATRAAAQVAEVPAPSAVTVAEEVTTPVEAVEPLVAEETEPAPSAAAPAVVEEVPPAKPARPKPEKPKRRKPKEEPTAEEEVAPVLPPTEREAARTREAVRRRELEAELAENEDEELRRLEEELARLEREEKLGAGLIALEELTPEEREQERRRGRGDLVKPIPERARRPTGPRTPTAVSVPPVVCVLGHVDHGKTTLLDALRQTNVTASEFGGITQHIGASEVELDGRRIVFLDTPGHAAFTAMRARGALITDIAVLVVAADDGVMPQTVEAINHARSAGVPIIVALNKMDIPGANPDRVKQQLAEQGLVPEDWGGNTVVVPVSALKKQGLDDLMEMIFLVAEAELGDLWGDPAAPFAGVVVEAELDASRGPLATILVRNGSLKVGDIVICGPAYGRVRRINDWRGRPVTGEVGPGRPVQIVGLSAVPESGDIIEKASSLKVAREIAAEREEAMRNDRLATTTRSTLGELLRQFQEGGRKELNIVLKTDVWGSLQAMRQALYELNEELEEVEVNIIHEAVGEISESDVLLAMAANALVLGFHVDADPQARAMAESEGVDIRTFRVIYEAIDEIRAAMHGMLEPIYEDRVLGRAEVLQTFRISRVGVVAGCLVTEGRVERGAEMRVLREGEVVYEGRIESLRHLTEDVEAVEAGTECGIATTEYRGWKIGDVIECHRQVEIPRRLPSPHDARPSSVSASGPS